jgi:hypothetical protein
MLCLVRNSKGTGALLCCSSDERDCYVLEQPDGHFRVLGIVTAVSFCFVKFFKQKDGYFFYISYVIVDLLSHE